VEFSGDRAVITTFDTSGGFKFVHHKCVTLHSQHINGYRCFTSAEQAVLIFLRTSFTILKPLINF
jgi:hypothetical protein